MGHLIRVTEDSSIEVPSTTIYVVLDYLRKAAGDDPALNALVGGGNYEFNSSAKLLPLTELSSHGANRFIECIKQLLEDLPSVSKSWNRPEYEKDFRSHMITILKMMEKQDLAT